MIRRTSYLHCCNTVDDRGKQPHRRFERRWRVMGAHKPALCWLRSTAKSDNRPKAERMERKYVRRCFLPSTARCTVVEGSNASKAQRAERDSTESNPTSLCQRTVSHKNGNCWRCSALLVQSVCGWLLRPAPPMKTGRLRTWDVKCFVTTTLRVES